ncbi:MAG: PhzF family phenazine biosynthesis isomerase [Nitriliruptoraceae bacterium]
MQRTEQVLRYAAFTRDPAGGNPAGVVVTDALRPDRWMQEVAADIGFSETAFVTPRRGEPDGYHDIRYFSPEREVAFCGHATIATAIVLAEQGPGRGRLRFHSRTDEIPVAVETIDGVPTARFTSPAPSHRPVAPATLAAALAAFGWGSEVLDPDLPPVVASAGADHLVVPLFSRSTLAAMSYDFEALRALMLDGDWTTVAVVWRESPTRYHARNAFPVGGVVEDPATGAAAAALGGYLRDAGFLTPPERITILQGEDLGRPSTLVVDVPADRPGIDVSGSAVPMT